MTAEERDYIVKMKKEFSPEEFKRLILAQPSNSYTHRAERAKRRRNLK